VSTPEAEQPQPVLGPFTEAAIFLVGVAAPDGEDALRHALADVTGLKRSVGFRIPEGQLSCVVGIGSDLWDRICLGGSRPQRLHRFVPLAGARHTAVSTPGDLLFHIRAHRLDLCFELAQRLTDRLAGLVRIIDEVHGFRSFDERDLLGFVDGTENPEGMAAEQAITIGGEDPGFAGGSYVIVQKYLHDLSAWDALPVEQQELAIGRTKLSDIELADAVKPANSHVALNTIVDENGVERDIVRFNMPFGRVSDAEFGTYFIGYAGDPGVIEQMLRNMFIGDPIGNTDRILDFSTAVTGNLFFIPTVDLLDGLADPPPQGDLSGAGEDESGAGEDESGTGGDESGTGGAETDEATAAAPTNHDGSLGIGGLRGASA
jgi:putative iron-dependent peroxidase